MGRPKMDPAERRSEPMYVALRKSERAAVDELSEQTGLTRSHIIQRAVNAYLSALGKKRKKK